MGLAILKKSWKKKSLDILEKQRRQNRLYSCKVWILSSLDLSNQCLFQAPREVTWAILKLVINTALTSFVQCLADNNSLSYMEGKKHIWKGTRKRKVRYTNDQQAPSSLPPQNPLPTPCENYQRKQHRSHIHLLCSSDRWHRQRLHKASWTGPHWRNPGLGPCAGDEQQGLFMVSTRRKGSPMQNQSLGLPKGSHQEKILNSLLSNHSCSTLLQYQEPQPPTKPAADWWEVGRTTS